mmetsp:Transcript_7854/g.18503  ORF Transcript_7854/g.18503 Transcript_7854/m.18503 type:complete len:395 (-) Transcript_7854:40-1224(-)
MATARAVVTVYGTDGKKSGTAVLPPVLKAPLRPDLVRYIHTQVSKNRRQPYARKFEAGYQHSAISWGTGRAVARIPRVQGGGTHGAACGAFGNMCRGGGMFSPIKIWRKWHCKVPRRMKRHAAASALAASALPALVMAKGHRISRVNELPLVVKDDWCSMKTTKEVIALCKTLHLDEDLKHVKDSKHIRPGKGKSRNRKYKINRGPLFIGDSEDGFFRASVNVPGLECVSVDYMSITQLAPGGTLGRMVVWSESAFKKLGKLFGSYHQPASLKKGYHLPRPVMTNADLARIINSDEIQSVLNPAKERAVITRRNGNPLKNKALMAKLNPGSLQKRKLRHLQAIEGTEQRKALLEEKKKRDDAKKAHNREHKNKFYKDMLSYYKKEEPAEQADEE